LQQQARFDKFIEVFNNERPHEALDMKCPAEVYQPSARRYQGLPDIGLRPQPPFDYWENRFVSEQECSLADNTSGM
jgi:hypothetical protein